MTGMNSNENLTFRVRLSTSARNYLKRTDKVTQKRITTAIEAIRANPINGPNIRPVQGYSQKYRYRIGNIRIIYTLKTEENLIIINTIGPRGDVYKK